PGNSFNKASTLASGRTLKEDALNSSVSFFTRIGASDTITISESKSVSSFKTMFPKFLLSINDSKSFLNVWYVVKSYVTNAGSLIGSNFNKKAPVSELEVNCSKVESFCWNNNTVTSDIGF